MPGQVGRTHQRRRKNEGRQEVWLSRRPFDDRDESSSYVHVPAAHACLGVLARPCTPIETAQKDMSPQHIRLMEVAEILRRAGNERTGLLTMRGLPAPVERDRRGRP